MDRICHDSRDIAGVDEAGRGCLAGPVVAAAVILPQECSIVGLDDSKKLSRARREKLALEIKAQAVAWALGLSWPREIEEVNILQATLKAMARSVQRLKRTPKFLYIDGNRTTHLSLPQQAVVGGDGLIPCISAASIVAKTFRDHLLVHLDRRYPGYGLAGHKGYGTRIHLERIRALGPSPQHRATFRGVRPETRGRELCLPGI
ncbi:MAG TPA: ribonuclease HII [Desulfomicrobiaceae bacterium]|nr:ribonuclease HII [Desulfomicrobiaceae bacterium]